MWGRQHCAWRLSDSVPHWKQQEDLWLLRVCGGLSTCLSIIRGLSPLTFLFSSLLILAGVSEWTDRHCCVELKLQSHCSLNLDRKHSERRLHLQEKSKKPHETRAALAGHVWLPSWHWLSEALLESWGSCYTSYGSPSFPPPSIIQWSVAKIYMGRHFLSFKGHKLVLTAFYRETEPASRQTHQNKPCLIKQHQ